MIFSNRTPNSIQFIDDNAGLKGDSIDEAAPPTTVYLVANVPYGYTKREPETSLKLLNSQAIENYGTVKELQRRFVFNHIFDSKFDHSNLFDTVVKPLANSAFHKGLQHSLVLYEPYTNNYYLDFLGIFDQQKNLDECQLFHTLKHIIELCTLKSHVPTNVQVSMVAIKDNKIIDMYNQDQPMESPLGYTLERVEHIESFLDYAHNLVDECPGIEHLCISIYYQNKIALSNDEFELRDACVNFIIVRGDNSIHLPSFLNNDKDGMNANTMSNQVEKLLLHFLSSSYDPDNLPYSDSTLSYFLKKYLPYSARKEIILYTDMKQKCIEEIANHLLYAELCQEVAEAPKEDSQDYTESRAEQPSAYESRILQNLSLTRDRIQSEFQGLQQKKHNIEDSVVKLESASTAGTNPNPLSQIQKFTLNSQYERFLHEMNHKLADLVHASDRLLTEVSTHKDDITHTHKSGVENRDPREKVSQNHRRRRYITPRRAEENITDDKVHISSMRHQQQNSMVVKDVEHQYPSEMLNDSNVLEKEQTHRTNASSKPQLENENKVVPKSNRDVPANSLIGNIELLQKELQHNLEFFSANFENLKRQIQNQDENDLSQRSRASRNILQSIIEQKRAEFASFKERHENSLLASLDSGKPDLHDASPQQQRQPHTTPHHGSETHLKPNSKTTLPFNKPKELKIPPLQNNIPEVDESQTLKTGQITTKRAEEPVLLTMRSGTQTSRGIEPKIPMSITKKQKVKEIEQEAEIKKQEMLGQTWKKLLAFSYKDVNSMMNNLFFSLSKENQGNAICGGPKSTQKVNPANKFHLGQTKVEMVSTIEEFRTTYEKFETLADQNSDNERFQRLQDEDSKCIEEDEEDDFENKQDGVAGVPLTKEFMNNSIASIKPIENNKASTISIPFSPDLTPNKNNKGSIKVTDLYNFDPAKGDPNNPSFKNGYVMSERERFNQSIINKLDELDKEDLKTKVIRSQTYM